MDGSTKVCVFNRDYPKVDGRNFWTDGDKWAPLYDLLREQKGKVEILAVSAPEVLGDTYRELVVNLVAIAQAGMMVSVEPSRKIVGFTTPVTVEFKGSGTLPPVKKQIIEQTPAEGSQADPNFKRWSGIICPGRKPALTLLSTAPEETYAQAQLLLMLDREMFRPSSQGREVMGTYDVNAATIEEFLQDYIERPEDLKLLEKNRREILKNGWASFLPKAAQAALPKAAPPPGVYHCLFAPDQPATRETPATAAKIKAMVEKIRKENAFQCLHCMGSLPAARLERIGTLVISTLFSGFSPEKAFVYPLCRTCVSVPEDQMFKKVERNLVERSEDLPIKLEESVKETIKADIKKRENDAFDPF